MSLIREEGLSPATRAERLERAIDQLRKRFGQWIVYRLQERRPSLGEKIVSTGSIGLDKATGTGGVGLQTISRTETYAKDHSLRFWHAHDVYRPFIPEKST